jgi:hypothetical protein
VLSVAAVKVVFAAAVDMLSVISSASASVIVGVLYRSVNSVTITATGLWCCVVAYCYLRKFSISRSSLISAGMPAEASRSMNDAALMSNLAMLH